MQPTSDAWGLLQYRADQPSQAQTFPPPQPQFQQPAFQQPSFQQQPFQQPQLQTQPPQFAPYPQHPSTHQQPLAQQQTMHQQPFAQQPFVQQQPFGQPPFQHPGQPPFQQPGQQPLQYPGQQPLQYPGQQPLQYPGQQPFQYPGQQPFQHPGQQPFQQQPLGQPPPQPRWQTDPRAQFQQYMTHVTPGQFKPVKLYVLFNDRTSLECVEAVRANSDLDRQVEVINADRPENRPAWLTGVPSLLDASNSFFLGSQCVAWIKYHSAKSLRGVNESTGTSQIMPGAPAVIDGSSKMSGILSGASFVPQQMVSDCDLVHSIGNDKAAQRFDQFTSGYAQQPIIPPPPGWGGQQSGQQGVMPLPPQMQPVRVGKDNGNAEKMNYLIEQIQNDRGALMNRVQVPHHMQQQQMSWAPAAPGWK